jgi:hypothetical protein
MEIASNRLSSFIVFFVLFIERSLVLAHPTTVRCY